MSDFTRFCDISGKSGVKTGQLQAERCQTWPEMARMAIPRRPLLAEIPIPGPLNCQDLRTRQFKGPWMGILRATERSENGHFSAISSHFCQFQPQTGQFFDHFLPEMPEMTTF